jgi:AcrR family transcriptional regulator
MDGTAARTLRADARRNRQRLLIAARQAVDEHGAEIALEDVARRAGVGIGTLYRHFPNRDAVLEAVLTEHYDELTERVRQAAAAAPNACEALFAFMRLFLDHITATQGLVMAVKPALKDDTTQLSAAHRRMREVTDELLAATQRSGKVRADITSADIYRLVAGIVWSSERAGACASDTERLLSVVLAGLRVDPSPPTAAAPSPRD